MSTVVLCGVVAILTWVGVELGKSAPWGERAQAAGLPTAIGVGLGPLLLGALGSAVMFALGPVAPAVHLAATLALAVAIGLLARKLQRPSPILTLPLHTARGVRWLDAVLLAFAVVLAITAWSVPRNINDAMEYLLVARDLAVTRDLAGTYPGLAPAQSPSGFFFAWTHPPSFVVLQYLVAATGTPLDGLGLSSVVGVWPAISTAVLVRATAGAIDARSGSLAGVLLLATPLYFLGAAGSLIDPLPVLGATVIAAVLVGQRAGPGTRPLRGDVALGASIGLALWTHSVAVLFVPIAFAAAAWLSWFRRESPRAALRSLAVALSLAFAIGAGPYARNIATVGALVSDSADVVSMNALGWEEFYDYSRGVNTFAAKVQYGVLKGIFAPEAYGAAFLLAFIGVALVAHPRWRRTQQAEAAIVTAWWVVAFVLGVSASLLLGTNQLIRNERYFLMILGPASVVGALGATNVWDALRPRLGRSATAVRWLTVLGFLCGLALLVQFAAGPLRQRTAHAGDRLQRRSGWPGLRMIATIDTLVPAGATVLSFRPGDFAYGHRRVLTHLDDRLVTVYEASTSAEALRRLRTLGIDWVHVSDYGPPSLYATKLSSVLADPSASTLVASESGHQLYRLAPSTKTAEGAEAVIVNPVGTAVHRIELGGRKALGAIPVSRQQIAGGEASRAQLPLGLFQRHHSTVLSLHSAVTDSSSHTKGPLVALGPELRLTLTGTGDGYVRVMLVPLDASGHDIEQRPILVGEFVVTNGATFVFSQRTFVPTRARAVRVQLQHFGNSWIQVDRVAAQFYR